MSGLTPEGFVAKRTPELKIELEQRLLDVFGSVNLNPSSVFGQLVGLTVEQQADFWNRLEEVYFSQYPSSATGVNLDRVVALNGLTRLPARSTAVLAVLTGVPGTTIAAGRLAAIAQTGHQYQLTSPVTLTEADSVGVRVEVTTLTEDTDYTINLDGTPYTYNSGPTPTETSILTNIKALLDLVAGITSVVTTEGDEGRIDIQYDTPMPIVVTANMTVALVSNYGDFAAVNTGPQTAPVGSLTQIVTPVAGWETVLNRFEGTVGRDAETDTELRLRRAESLKIAGQNTLDSIVTRIRQLPGVLAQRVVVNNTDSTDSEGIPAHSIRAIVDGGVEEAIARVLYDYVAAGIGYFGAVEVDVLSTVTGTPFEVKFDRPVNVPFYVTVTIQGSPATPTDAVSAVRNALMDHTSQLTIAESVLYTRLFSPINAVIGDGAYVTTMYINEHEIDDPMYETTANLVPDPDERFVLTPERIQVFVV